MRDDLFTHIHKALRLALFGTTALAGSTAWTDPDAVAELGARWRPVLALLRAHTAHEDDYILRILDSYDPAATQAAEEHHRDLDDLVDDLAHRFDRLAVAPDPESGLAWYRDLARFVAAYLPHLHDEETRIMRRIWECCTDEEIAATRASFMDHMSPEIGVISLEYMLPAVDPPTRAELISQLAATAPPFVTAVAMDIAQRVLDAADYVALCAATTPAA
jgi:hypothetical protein